MAAETIKPEQIIKPKNKTKAILALATDTQASPPEIAAILNISAQAVHQSLERHGIQPKRMESFKKHRADVFAGMQTKILKHIDEARLKKASAFQLVGSLGLLYDKERLERGQSTQNLASIHADIAALQYEDNPVDK